MTVSGGNLDGEYGHKNMAQMNYRINEIQEAVQKIKLRQLGLVRFALPAGDVIKLRPTRVT